MEKNYQKMHEERMEAMKKKILGSKVYETLQLKSISNDVLEDIRTKLSKVVPGKTTIWEDFNFRAGKIFGILRFIAQNTLYRKQLFEAIDNKLNDNHMDTYYDVCGNLPYLDKNNTINNGRPMDVEATKEFITVVAYELGVVLEEADLSDITQERWNRLYSNAMEKLIATQQMTEQHGESIPDSFDE